MTDWRDRMEQFDSREAWLEGRRKGIGASEWSAILGVDGAFLSEFEVFQAKRGHATDDDVPEYVEIGSAIEEVVAGLAAKRIGRPIKTYDNATIRSEDFPWLMCSPDGFVGDREQTLYEGKNANAYKRTAWFEGVPLVYEVQCQAGMFVTGLTKCVIACLIGGSELVHKELDYNPDFIDWALPQLERFWQAVQDPNAAGPNPGASDRDRKVLVSMFPQDDGGEAQLPHEHFYLVKKRVEAARRIKEDEAIVKGVDNLTRRAMGTASVAYFSGIGKYTHKTNKRGVRTLRFTEEK